VVRATITGYIVSMPWKVGDHIKSGSLFCSIITKEQDALKNVDNKDQSLQQFQAPIKVISAAAAIFTAVNYVEGNFVNEGDVLATITDPTSLVLVVNVPYEYHDLVYKGKTCEVTFPDGKKINADINEVVPFVDANSQTQSCLIRFPENQLLPENMNLLVKIPVKQKSHAISLPLEAIQTDETQKTFWVMKLINDSIAVKIPVTVGLQNDSLKEVITGIGENDRIVLTGGYGLTDSARIKIQNP
jgi:multidrug efflux pump subunit AcrA (membrane-fusion protein)